MQKHFLRKGEKERGEKKKVTDPAAVHEIPSLEMCDRGSIRTAVCTSSHGTLMAVLMAQSSGPIYIIQCPSASISTLFSSFSIP